MQLQRLKFFRPVQDVEGIISSTGLMESLSKSRYCYRAAKCVLILSFAFQTTEEEAGATTQGNWTKIG